MTGLAARDATGANYTFDVVPTQDGTITVNVAAGAAQSTANGLDNTAAAPFEIRSDRTAPTPDHQLHPARARDGGQPRHIPRQLSEAVPGFTSSGVTLSGAGADGATVDSFVNDGKDIVYTFEVAPTADGPVNVDVAAGVAADRAATTTWRPPSTPYSTTLRCRVPPSPPSSRTRPIPPRSSST